MESMNGQEIFTGEYGIKENADMNGIEDLKKANWYLELMMEVVDNGDKKS